jgi:hypothetical protein
LATDVERVGLRNGDDSVRVLVSRLFLPASFLRAGPLSGVGIEYCLTSFPQGMSVHGVEDKIVGQMGCTPLFRVKKCKIIV